MLNKQVEKMMETYNKIIQDSTENKDILKVNSNSRKPVTSVIKGGTKAVSKVFSKVPDKSGILESLLPPKLRGLIGTSLYLGSAAKDFVTSDSAKSIVERVAEYTKVMGTSPKSGKVKSSVKKLERSIGAESSTSDQDYKELDKRKQEGDALAEFILHLKKTSDQDFVRTQMAMQYNAKLSADKMDNITGFLSNIDKNIASMHGMQAVGLKAKYETLFVLKEILAVHLNNNNLTNSQLNAIVLNTALPDSTKEHLTDIGKKKIKNRLVDTGFRKADVIKKVLYGKAGSIFKGSIDPGSAVGRLRKANLPGIDDETVLDTGVQSIIAKLRLKIKDDIDKTLYAGRGLSSIGNTINQLIEGLGDKVNKNADKKGFKGILARLAKNVSSIPGVLSSEVGGGRYGDDDEALFDGRTHVTINQVIPSLLSKILASSEGIRLGEEQDTEEFVYSSQTFQKTGAINKAVRDVTKDSLGEITIDDEVDNIMDMLTKNGNYTPEAYHVIRGVVKKTMLDNYMSDSPFDVITSIAKLAQHADIQKADTRIKEEIQAGFTKSKDMMSFKEISVLSRKLQHADDATENVNLLVKSLVSFYGTGPLVKQGLITVSGDKYYINKEFIKKILEGGDVPLGLSHGRPLDGGDPTGPTKPKPTPPHDPTGPTKPKPTPPHDPAGPATTLDATFDEIKGELKDLKATVESTIKEKLDDTNATLKEKLTETTDTLKEQLREEFNATVKKTGIDPKNLKESATSVLADTVQNLYEKNADTAEDLLKTTAKNTEDLLKTTAKNAEDLLREKFGHHLDAAGVDPDNLMKSAKDMLEDSFKVVLAGEKGAEDLKQDLADNLTDILKQGREEVNTRVSSVVNDLGSKLKKEAKSRYGYDMPDVPDITLDTITDAVSKLSGMSREEIIALSKRKVKDLHNFSKNEALSAIKKDETGFKAAMKEKVEQYLPDELRDVVGDKIVDLIEDLDVDTLKKDLLGHAQDGYKKVVNLKPDDVVDLLKGELKGALEKNRTKVETVVTSSLIDKLGLTDKDANDLTSLVKKKVDAVAKGEVTTESLIAESSAMVGSLLESDLAKTKITTEYHESVKELLLRVTEATTQSKTGSAIPKSSEFGDLNKDGFEDGSYKDIINRRKAALDAGKDFAKKDFEKKGPVTEKVSGLLQSLLGNAGPLIGGGLSILGGVVGFAGNILGIIGKLGLGGIKVLQMLGIGKLGSLLVGKLGFLKKVPMGGVLLSSVDKVFKGLASNKLSGAATAIGMAGDLLQDDGEGGYYRRKTERRDRKRKNRRKLKKRAKSKIGKVANVATSLGGRIIDMVRGNKGKALAGATAATVGGLLLSSANAADLDQVGSLGTEAVKTGIEEYTNTAADKASAVGLIRDSAIYMAVEATDIAITGKEVLKSDKAVKARSVVSGYISKYGSGPTKKLLPSILSTIGNKSVSWLVFGRELIKLPFDKIVLVVTDVLKTYFYFLKTPAGGAAIKGMIKFAFKGILKVFTKLIPGVALMDTWVYARIFGTVINDMLENHNIHVGVLMYDLFEELDWNDAILAFDIDSAEKAWIDSSRNFFGEGIIGAMTAGMEFTTKMLDKMQGYDRSAPITAIKPTTTKTVTEPVGSSDPFKGKTPPAPIPRSKRSSVTNQIVKDGTEYVPKGDDGKVDYPKVPRANHKAMFGMHKYKKWTGGTVYLATKPNMEYVRKYKSGVLLDGLHINMKRILDAISRDYHAITGRKLQVNSGFRTAAMQRRTRGGARVGTSSHEFGLAIDINTVDLNLLDKHGLMAKYGLYRPMGAETWHAEPIGIQFNRSKCMRSKSYAYNAIMAGIGRGGGGPSDKSSYSRRGAVAQTVWHAGKETKVVLSDNIVSDIKAAKDSPAEKINKATTKIESSVSNVPPEDRATQSGTKVYKPFKPSPEELKAYTGIDPVDAVDPLLSEDGKTLDSVAPSAKASAQDGAAGVGKVMLEQDPQQTKILAEQLNKHDTSIVLLGQIRDAIVAVQQPTKVKVPTPPPKPKPVNLKDNFGLA